jgi:cyclopropane-fatty-acyl-phospholipid synthase
MDLLTGAAERGWLPDALIRVGIRRLCARKAADERRGDPAARAARRAERVQAMRAGVIALHTAEANLQHYEVPTEYYRLVLGPHLKYSSALWDGATDLGAAEEAMLRTCDARAQLADGQRVLELGCGWGSWSLWMAQRFPGSRITAVSNSATQREFITARARERGLGNLEVVTCDMNRFEPGARFDRVVSVEMFEHMRDWVSLLARIRGWLEPQGSLFVHVFCHRDSPYFFETDGRSDWMARHFFTGGLMPSEDLLEECAAGSFRLAERWRVDGTHYARTARAWLANHDAHRAGIEELFARSLGREGGRVQSQRWRMFHMACEELFAFDAGREWFVSHARLVPGDPA